MLNFLIDTSKGETPASVARKRALVAQLMGQSRAPQNVGEGLNALGDGIVAAVMNRRADKAEAAGRGEGSNAFASLFSGMGGVDTQAPEMAGNTAVSPGSLPAQDTAGGSSYRDAIASIESAGSGDYQAIGPTHPKLGRALGRYQVMEANIGPWSQEALGRAVTPEEFLKNPQLQDAIFDKKFGSYVEKYGNPQDAASMWFTGRPAAEGANAKDVLGTSGTGYVNKFTQALGNGQPQMSPPVDPAMNGMAPPNPSRFAPDAQPVVPGIPGQQTMPLGPQAQQPTGLAAAQPPQPAQMPPMGQPAPQPPMQVAQAGQGQFPPAPPPPQNNRVQQLMQVMTNPWLSDQERQVAGMMLQQEMQKNDPMRQLEMEKTRLEMDAMRNPKPNLINGGDGRLYDPASGKWITAPDAAQKAPQVVELFDEASGQPYKATWNAETKQYERVGGVKARTGMQLTTNPDGTVSLTEGPISNRPKLTADEAKNAGFLERGVAANKVLEALEGQGTSLWNKTIGNVPVFGNYARSEDAQKYDQAKRDLVNAILRRESGAVISDEEFANAEQQYFPQPGDGPEVVEQKRKNREAAIKGFDIGAGQGAGMVTNPPGQVRRLKFNPQTGELE